MSLKHPHSSEADVAWRHDGVRVITSNRLDPNTEQTPGVERKAGSNAPPARAQHIHPDAKTGAHHRGELESVIYVHRGRARMRWDNAPEFPAQSGPGDFI